MGEGEADDVGEERREQGDVEGQATSSVGQAGSDGPGADKDVEPGKVEVVGSVGSEREPESGGVVSPEAQAEALERGHVGWRGGVGSVSGEERSKKKQKEERKRLCYLQERWIGEGLLTMLRDLRQMS